jgi:hypothetical protein
MARNAREARARRTAERQGLQLAKSRTRDQRALGFGRWWVSKAGEAPVAGLDYALALDDVEAFLAGQLPGFEVQTVWDEQARGRASFLGEEIARVPDLGYPLTAYAMTGGRLGVYGGDVGHLSVYANFGAFAAEWAGEPLAADVAAALGAGGTMAR